MKYERTQPRMAKVLNLVVGEQLVNLLHAAAEEERVSHSQFIRQAVAERAKRVLRKASRPMASADNEPRPAA